MRRPLRRPLLFLNLASCRPKFSSASRVTTAAGSGAALLLFVILKYRRRAPFPFAGAPIEAGDAALDHFVAPLVARHDEGGQVAAAEAKSHIQGNGCRPRWHRYPRGNGSFHAWAVAGALRVRQASEGKRGMRKTYIL